MRRNGELLKASLKQLNAGKKSEKGPLKTIGFQSLGDGGHKQMEIKLHDSISHCSKLQLLWLNKH